MDINLVSYVVRAADGSVDQDATVEKFANDLEVYALQSEKDEAEIADAVNAVFDEFHGTRINMPALASMALTRLSATPATFQTLQARVLNYVRENSQGKKLDDAGTVEHPESLFVIGKGKLGGVTRRADIAPSDSDSSAPSDSESSDSE